MDEQALQQRIKQLAETLQATGIAASPARAEEMARDIVSTEQRQLQKLDQKKHDVSLNPQQRTGSQGMPVKEVQLDEGIDQQRPISELLSDDDESVDLSEQPLQEQVQVEQEMTPAAESPQPTKQVQEEAQLMQQPVQEAPEHQVEQEMTPVQESPQPTKPVQEAPEHQVEQEMTPVQESPQPRPQAQQAPQPVPPAEVAPQTQPQQAQPEQQQAPEQPQDSEQEAKEKALEEKRAKAAESKVDLSEMFNFSKR